MRRAPDAPWRDGNRVRLLENGEGFFERAFEAIAGARREILLETFILFEDKVGLELHRRLVEAARRGVRVELTVDGYGSPGFSEGFLAGLADAGATLRVFDPHRTLFGLRLHVFRRMHRKILVVDGERAFVGGINYSADHLGDFGEKSKQDYAVELEGPVVADIRDFALSALRERGDGAQWRHPAASAQPRSGDADRGHGRSHGGRQASIAGDARVLFELRDNAGRSDNIERLYRDAIRGARSRIVIANAYFFPALGFLRELKQAARRGVDVSLIVQGEPDSQFAMSAARALYPDLVAAGIAIREYCERPFHGKVALVDDDWATVGSSNLDPLSLSLNLEANVFIRDRAFNHTLHERLHDLGQHHCRRIEPGSLRRRSLWQRLWHPLLYHGQRHFPAWAGLLPAHTPKLVPLAPGGDGEAAGGRA